MKRTYTLLLLFLLINALGKSQTSISGIINNYAKVDSINFCSNAIHIPSTTDFSVGDRVLIIQMKGATVDLTNTFNFGNILSYNSAGNYEFATIASKTGTSVTLQNKILRTYEITGLVQLIRVPVYDDVTVDGDLTCQPWNGSTGGVLAFDADQITMNADMDVSGKGFGGGKAINYPSSCPTGLGSSVYFTDTLSGKSGQKGEGIVVLAENYLAGRGKAANGGGAGNDHNAGGGGGCIGGAAGAGGENDESPFSCPGSPGAAGIPLDNTAVSNKLFMGGGGGSGHGNNSNGTNGSNGGGIIFITANQLDGNNDTIKASALDVEGLAWGDGAGGGGAGGSIFLDINSVDDVRFNFIGGRGGDSGADQCTGPGGGGSGGVMKSTPSTIITGSTYTYYGGFNGIVATVTSPCYLQNNGATFGTTGEKYTTLSIPESIIPYNPEFADAGADQTVCLGESVILDGSGGVSYSWFPTTFLDDPTVSDPESTPTSDISYVLTVTNAEGCSDVDLVLVDVLPEINPDAGADVSVCSGESVSLSASGGASYVWSPVLYLDDPTISNPVSTPLAAITYTVTVTDANGCVGTDMVEVDVNPSDFLVTSDDIAVCSGGSVTLYAAGGTSYLWSPSTYLDDPTSPNPVATPLGDISYTVTSINMDGCTDSEIVNVSLTIADFLVVNDDVEVCYGDSIILHAEGGTSYVWSPSTYLDDPTSADPIAVPLSDIIYTVTSINADGCSDEETITINVLPVEFADVSPDQIICSGTSTTLSATGGINYLWSPTTYLDDPTSSTPISTPLSDITYFITVTSAEGCTDVDTVNISMYPEIIINAGPDTSVCFGGQFKLFAEGGIEYLWVPATNLDNPAISDPTCNPSESIDYVVFVTDINGCVGTDTVNVVVNTAPAITTVDDFTICRGDSITLTADGGINYIWTPDPLFACGICETAEFAPTATTTYLVQGFDANGCSATADVTVTVDICNAVENILADQINIYPNPANNIIFISSDPDVEIISFMIMNMTGEKIESNILLNNSINEIHLSDMPSQPIIIQVITDKGILNKMIIIE